MKTGKPNKRVYAENYHKASVATGTKLSWNGYTRKPDTASNRPSHTRSVHVGEDELDYSVHLAAKMDYIIYHKI